MERTPQRLWSMPRTAWVVAGLAVFVAVDIVLIALALGWGRDAPRVVERGASVESSFQAEDDSEETLDEPLQSAAPEEPRVAPRLISAVSETVAWRSEGGACAERSEIELTVDGGQTWGSAYPAVDRLGRPLWLSGADYLAVQSAIASGPDCERQGIRTYDSGASWTQDDQVVTNSVLVDPGDPSLVIWGGDAVEGPCDDTHQVAVTGGVAAAVCSDGSVWTTPMGSTGWSESSIEAAVALSGSDGRWMAAVESADCQGLRLVEFDDASAESYACAPAEAAAEVAIDLSGNALWLWSGDQVMISTDFGRSFN
ncbi:hypothetical protein GCM10009650_06730 [Nesterenkonia jeotgali]|uniref:hypothetical protein n=1 Tax=Nesterenkonia jeotgali TaxID=317018 RepID=UPI0015FB66D1|nr:hypothetical protein [Nesterenkonia jeotgali]